MADRRYYTEGSSARQLNYDDRAGRNRSREAVVRGSAAPARRPQPSVRPERAPQPARRKKQGSSHLTDRCQVTEGVSGNAEEPGGNTA